MHPQTIVLSVLLVVLTSSSSSLSPSALESYLDDGMRLIMSMMSVLLVQSGICNCKRHNYHHHHHFLFDNVDDDDDDDDDDDYDDYDNDGCGNGGPYSSANAVDVILVGMKTRIS